MPISMSGASQIGMVSRNGDFGAPVLFPGNAKARPVGLGAFPRRLKARLGCAEQVMPGAKASFAFFGGALSPYGFRGSAPSGPHPPYGEAGKAYPRKTEQFSWKLSGWIYGIHRAQASTKLRGFEAQGFGTPTGQSSYSFVAAFLCSPPSRFASPVNWFDL